MTISNKYNSIYNYRNKYYQLFFEYIKKYYEYQNQIYEEMRIKRFYEFKVVIYINYQSKKGKVKKSIHKSYNLDQYQEVFSEYLAIKETKQFYQINSRMNVLK